MDASSDNESNIMRASFLLCTIYQSRITEIFYKIMQSGEYCLEGKYTSMKAELDFHNGV